MGRFLLLRQTSTTFQMTLELSLWLWLEPVVVTWTGGLTTGAVYPGHPWRQRAGSELAVGITCVQVKGEMEKTQNPECRSPGSGSWPCTCLCGSPFRCVSRLQDVKTCSGAEWTINIKYHNPPFLVFSIVWYVFVRNFKVMTCSVENTWKA